MKAIQASEVIERVQNVREGKLRVRTELTDVLQPLIQGVERGIDPVVILLESQQMIKGSKYLGSNRSRVRRSFHLRNRLEALRGPFAIIS